MGKIVAVLVAVASLSTQGQRLNDLAVLNALGPANHFLNGAVWHRPQVAADLDLVIAVANPQGGASEVDRTTDGRLRIAALDR